MAKISSFFAGWRPEIVVRVVVKHRPLRQGFQHLSSVPGITEGIVKGHAFFQPQKVYCVLQGTPAFSVLMDQAEDLLDVIVAQGCAQRIRQLVVAYIALELQQVQGPPGTEMHPVPTPGHKV